MESKYIQQGDIFYATLPENRGSEESGRRPVLVISSSRMAWSSTVIVVPLTSNMTYRNKLTHVPFQFTRNKQSLAMCEHLRELDKQFLDEKIGYANRTTMRAIMGIIKEFVLREEF